MKYLKDPRNGFAQNTSAQLFHDRANEAAGELKKFIVSISVGAIGFLYLEMGISPKDSIAVRAITLFTLASFFLSAGLSVLAWHFDARRFYMRAKSEEASEENTREELYFASRSLTTFARRLTWSARVLFALGITGLFLLGVLRSSGMVFL